jgi:hypothetical protein
MIPIYVQATIEASPSRMSFLMNQGMSMSKEAEAGASPQDVVDHLRNGLQMASLQIGLSQEMRFS